MKYIAFLRAINVGGRRIVRMAALREAFESLGYSNVETFIASGNVIFESRSRDTRALEAAIAGRLRARLGYDVDAFVRTPAEVSTIAEYQPFRRAAVARAAALNVAFLAAPPGEAAANALLACRTEIDDLHVQGREVYWLRRSLQRRSTFSNAVLEKAVGGRSTLRGMNTVRKMAAKYAGPHGR